MRHIGIHLNWGQKVDPLYEWRPPLVVTANLSPELAVFKHESPSTILIARGFPDDQRNPNFNEPFDVKATARQDTEEAITRTAQTSPDVVQVTNEPVLDKNASIGPDAVARQGDYDIECARVAHGHGYRTTFGNWAWGGPEVQFIPRYYKALEVAVELGFPVLLHEYDLPDVDTVWSLYRHRLWRDILPANIKAKLRIIVGETGPHWFDKPQGWQGRMSPEEYVAWAGAYDKEVHRDEYILGSALFAKALYDPLWYSFDTTPIEHELIRLADPVYRPLPRPQPIEPPTQLPLYGRYFPGEDLRGKLARHPDKHYKGRTLRQVNKTIIHHSAVRPKRDGPRYIRKHIERIAEQHVEKRGWPTIAYHAIVGPAGDAYLVNSLRVSAYHAGRMNPVSFGICMLGRFDEGWDLPTDKQVAKVNQICRWLRRPVYPHKHFMKTKCPGRFRRMDIDWAI